MKELICISPHWPSGTNMHTRMPPPHTGQEMQGNLLKQSHVSIPPHLLLPPLLCDSPSFSFEPPPLPLPPPPLPSFEGGGQDI